MPIYDIVREIGLELEFELMDPNTSGWIKRLSNGSYRIVVHANHAPTRQRFTAAHELGHYIYHRDLLGDGVGDDRAYRSDVPGHTNANILTIHERQANTFAANILMPRHVLLAMDRNDPDSLAAQFQVSKAAMKIRLGIR